MKKRIIQFEKYPKTMIKYSQILILSICFAMLLSSCDVKETGINNRNTETYEAEENRTVISEENKNDDVRMDPYIFNRIEPSDKIKKEIDAHSYEGDTGHRQVYTLRTYKPLKNFTDVYGEKEFKRVEFEYADSYDSFFALCTYKQYLYFLIDEGNEHRICRYNMDNDTTEDVFTYISENQITLAAVDDDYLVWMEDENANWLKVSINCWDMNNKTNEKVYTYPRDENGWMYSWGFDRLVLSGDYLYFDSVVGKTDGKSDINLYRYNTKEHKTELVYEKRGAQPLLYNGISWLSFDDERGEYFIKNLDESVSPIYMGDRCPALYSSPNYIVGCEGTDAIMYYNGKASIPVIETTGNLDGICCTDRYIMWNGWSNDYPMFYDIEKETIVYTDIIEYDRRYKPYLSEDYLVFGANDFIADTAVGDGSVKTRALIFYHIKTDELH